MFYLDVIKDGHEEVLRFASKKDAEAFAAFTKVYVDDSGAGNGYGAYWVFLNARPYFRLFSPRKSVSELVPELVSAMLRSILCARQATNNPTMITWSSRNMDGSSDGITFVIDPIPPRQRPAVGDMYRIPHTKMSPDYAELGYSEGRVLAEENDTFTLRSCHNEEPSTGDLRGEDVTHSIAAERVMKINDWLLSMRDLARVKK